MTAIIGDEEHAKHLSMIEGHMRHNGSEESTISFTVNILKNDRAVAKQTAENFDFIQEERKPKSKLSRRQLNDQNLYNKINKSAGKEKTHWTYKTLRREMKKQYDRFTDLVRGDESVRWNQVDTGDDIHFLWEIDREEDSAYILKASCHMEVPPDRVVKLMTDTNFAKRMRWDPDNLCEVNITAEDGSTEVVPGIRLLRSISRPGKLGSKAEKLQLHQKYEIVESYIKPPTMFLGIPVPGVATRRYLVSQWVFQNTRDMEWIILTHSIDDPRYPLFKGMVDAKGFGGVRVEYDEEGSECHVTIIAHINPGGNIPSSVIKWGKTQLIVLLQKIKAGCQDPLYTDIYKN